MKTLRILFVLCLILSCTIPALSQGNEKRRPMKGSFYANVVETINPGLEKLSLNGNATHMGLFTGTMYFDKSKVVIVGNQIKNARTYGTIVAANGDEIFFESYPTMIITGMGPLGPYGTLTGKASLIDGTGRFMNCSGEMEQDGIFDMGNDYANWTVDGWIKY